MATLTSSGVTISRSQLMHTNESEERVMDVVITISSAGDATDTIPATAFGLTKFYGPTVFTKSDNSLLIVASPSVDGTILLLRAADTNAPATYSATLYGRVRGY